MVGRPSIPFSRRRRFHFRIPKEKSQRPFLTVLTFSSSPSSNILLTQESLPLPFFTFLDSHLFPLFAFYCLVSVKKRKAIESPLWPEIKMPWGL
jgi:hypothetical protein